MAHHARLKGVKKNRGKVDKSKKNKETKAVKETTETK